MNYSDIVKQISIKDFKPIYVLMGGEPYYIDKITELIEASVLTDDEKVMNETIVYGKEADIADVITDARQYPVFSPYRVIYIKEAQLLQNKDKLSLFEKYLEHPVSSTIIVITYKGGTIDKRKAWIKLADKLGVVFTSEQVREYQLPPLIEQMADRAHLDIDKDATELLVEYIGSDLTQLESVIQKFNILLPDGKRRITAEAIEKVVGISKDYNVFELANAMLRKDVRKANLIINHTSEAIQKIIPTLYNNFSNLLIYLYLPPGSTDSDAVAALKINPYFVKDYKYAATKYTKMQVFKAIGYLRKYDTMSKGVGYANTQDTLGLMKEMVYRILH